MFSLLFTLLISLPGLAQPDESQKKQEPDTNTPPPVHDSVFDKTHKAMSEGILSFTDTVDSLLGDDKIDIGGRRSAGVVALTSSLTDGQGLLTQAQLNLRIKLPRTESRLNLIVDNVSDKARNDEVEPTQLDKAKTETEDNGLAAALKYLFADEETWELNTNAGIKIRFPNLDPFASFRAKRNISLWKRTLSLTQNFFWFLNSGFGEVTRADIEFPLPKSFRLRFANSASWNENEKFFRFNHSLTLIHPVGDRKSLSYAIGGSGNSDPNVHVESYSIAASYRQNILRKWIFLDIIPGVSFPKSNGFASVASIAVRIESIFGEVN